MGGQQHRFAPVDGSRFAHLGVHALRCRRQRDARRWRRPHRSQRWHGGKGSSGDAREREEVPGHGCRSLGENAPERSQHVCFHGGRPAHHGGADHLGAGRGRQRADLRPRNRESRVRFQEHHLSRRVVDDRHCRLCRLSAQRRVLWRRRGGHAVSAAALRGIVSHRRQGGRRHAGGTWQKHERLPVRRRRGQQSGSSILRIRRPHGRRRQQPGPGGHRRVVRLASRRGRMLGSAFGRPAPIHRDGGTHRVPHRVPRPRGGRRLLCRLVRQLRIGQPWRGGGCRL